MSKWRKGIVSSDGTRLNLRLLSAGLLIISLAALPLVGLLYESAVNAQTKEGGSGQDGWYRLSQFPDKASDGVIAPVLRGFLEDNCKSSRLNPDQSPNDNFLFVNLEFSTKEAREAVIPKGGSSPAKGLTALTVFDRFADVFVDDFGCEAEESVNSISKGKGIVSIEYDGYITAPEPPPFQLKKEPSRAKPEGIVRGGYRGKTGKGVIIAILDSGIDFRHPDFITYDPEGLPTSRLLYLWDPVMEYEPGRGRPAPYKYPNGASIGTLFTQDDLTAELRSNGRNIPATDPDGHGTACAGIAAGNGNADFRNAEGLRRENVVGVAPEADLIGVRILPPAYLVNAVNAWLDNVAGKRPLVVTNSWGRKDTGHDGQTVVERQLDARYPTGAAGRSILYSAGNSAEDGIHASFEIEKGKSQEVRFSTEFNESLRVDFAVETFEDISFAPVGDSEVTLEWVYVNPISRHVVANFGVFLDGGIRFSTSGERSIKTDVYMFGQYGGSLSGESVDKRGVVGSPGSMRNSITTGSYDWNDNFHAISGRATALPTLACSNWLAPMVIGGISCYSSSGPTRDGRMKPEIAAPGQWYSASHSRINGFPVDPTHADITGNYILMNGTSASTPYTAGIVALMFEARPTLTLGEVKDMLMRNASKDGFTGVRPGHEWGAGKLDYAAVERIFAELEKGM